MQFEKGFLVQIARTSIVAHSCANESVHARSERPVQSFESREASTLVLAHESIERLSALELDHVAAEKYSSSMIHPARIDELLNVRRKLSLFHAVRIGLAGTACLHASLLQCASNT